MDFAMTLIPQCVETQVAVRRCLFGWMASATIANALSAWHAQFVSHPLAHRGGVFFVPCRTQDKSNVLRLDRTVSKHRLIDLSNIRQ